MKQIDSFQELEELLLKFQLPRNLTNNFLMPSVLEEQIQRGNLWIDSSLSNCCLLVDKGFCYQIYYHVNSAEEKFNLPVDKPLVLEIVYRGSLGYPEEVVSFWEKQGFAKYLKRDNLALAGAKVMPVTLNPDVVIELLNDDLAVNFAYHLFSKDLDRYTGDWRSLEEIHAYAINKQLLFAHIEGKLAGVLQMEHKNNINWLGHIAVSEEFRGRGIANSLVDRFIKHGWNGPSTKYQLWVIHDNEPAIKLYARFGFVYAGKSTASMIKFNYD
ncbi:hypothetical protein MASR2M44_14170 [Bacteroidota bacterium]